MNHLLMFIGENERFNVTQVDEILGSLPGVMQVRRNPGEETIIEVDLEDQDGSCIVRLNKDADTISASWHSRTALRAALAIQERLRTPIRVIDMNYDFDLILDQYPSVTELEQAIQVARERS